LKEIPHIFCWYCGFSTRAHFQLDDLIWHFFPYVCPYCWNGICRCGANKRLTSGLPPPKDEAELGKWRRKHARKRPHSLDEYVEMFRSVYGGHSDSSTLGNIYLHFSEEVGEVSRLVRESELISNRNARVEEDQRIALWSEVADVFSWVCKLCWRIDSNLQGFMPWARRHAGISTQAQKHNFRIRFSSMIVDEYHHGCPRCHASPCTSKCKGWTPGR
jgi:NTP pyrophosphatase (non-canonical NTP hydrolase)